METPLDSECASPKAWFRTDLPNRHDCREPSPYRRPGQRLVLIKDTEPKMFTPPTPPCTPPMQTGSDASSPAASDMSLSSVCSS